MATIESIDRKLYAGALHAWSDKGVIMSAPTPKRSVPHYKKTLAILFTILLGQLAFASEVDLYRGLLFWIRDQNNIEGNELRKTTYALSKEFDGSFSNSLDGVALPAKGSISFTLAFSFKVGKQDCLNRILRIGAHRHFYVDADNRLCSAIPVGSGTMYKEFKSSLVVRENAWYSMALRQDDDSHVYLFAGEKDAELGCVADYDDSKILEIDSASISMGTIVLGSCNYPSAGNLQSGQFANIRFWTRALTNDECAMADKCQDVILETKQLGCPSGVKYDFFPLSGNMVGVDESGITPKRASAYNASASGWRTEAGRLSSTGCAMSSDGDGRIVYENFSNLFGTTVFGELLTKTSFESGSYGMSYKVIRSYRSEPSLSSGSTTNASYVFWLKVDRFPNTGTHTIFSRNIRDSLTSKFPEDKELCLKVNPYGKLVLRQNGADTTLSGACLRTGEWALISVIGHAKRSVTVFVNKSEAGCVTSPITMGALCGIDTRWSQTKYSYIFATDQWGYPETSSGGEATRPIADMTIGGWNGAIDEIAFYGKALSAEEVTEIYEAACLPDPYTSINPTTRNFTTSGGGGAIITSGSSETWCARATEPWITLNSNSGNIGYPVAYVISATTNAEQRIGYVYINGHVHTVTQDGIGGKIGSDAAAFEHEGGNDTIIVEVQNGIAWKATPNVGWLSVSQRSGIGLGTVSYQVLPYNEVATRQGTLTVAGNTFTVFQYGRRMKLSTYKETRNYETHVIPITVNALDITKWNVTPNNSWISVVDGGNGQGGDLVTIAIAENPSYKARTGTVTIGTETFTVTQQGRPTEALSFNVSPANSTASVGGANGTIAVTATPDLPWTATSAANWLTVYAATANGAGNGNVVYNASPNPTLSQRVGKINVTLEAASGMTAKSHTVTQPAAQSALSMNGYEFEASGEPCSVEVSVASIVHWSVEESLDWITVNGSTSRTGPGTVVLQAAANNTVYPRSGTVTIAGKAFRVSQKARGVELEYDTMLFGTDGGYESISIHPNGNSAWTAVASDPTWITIFQGDSGTGDGEILYIVAPYVGDGTARTGWITVGDKKVYIAQRAYDLYIDPNGTNVVGNAGAGEFGVSASIDDVWTAIVTEPWITLISGYDSGTGSGVVRFIYTENDTGKTRTGKIIVNGEVYTLEQRARQMVAITATAEHGGSVSGGGSYDIGSKVVLTALPDSGYKFSYWTGAVSSMQNPLTVTVDVAQSYTAVFSPMPIAFTSVVSDTNGVSLAWNNLAWAATYRIYRGITSVPSSAKVLAELPNSGTCTYLDETGDVDVEYWYWIEAEGPSDEVMSDPMTGRKEKPIVFSPITYTNLRGATNPNPATYQEGTLVSFKNPGAVTGYTFAGWTPSQITADMTGAQTVRAAWTANSYTIAYNPSGGSGTMAATPMVYDKEGVVATSTFTYDGHEFIGWATNATGEVVYSAGQTVSNLTAQSGGVVTLYAVWRVAGPQFHIDGNGILVGVDLNGVTDIEIPSSAKSIGDYAFESKDLTSVTIPESVTNVGNNAFRNCSEMTNVVIMCLGARWTMVGGSGGSGVSYHGVASIGDFAFEGCRKLKSVTIPECVKKIGSYAFHCCSGLTSVTIPNSVTSIGEGAFRNCGGLADVTISNSVTNIGNLVFSSCNALVSVTIPNSVASIGDYGFEECRGLVDVTMPNSVKSIGKCAFRDCHSLASMTIPNSVTSIGEGAFNWCYVLTNVTMKGDCPIVCGSAFEGVSASCVVRLPYGNTTYEVVDGKWQGMTVEYYVLPPVVAVPVVTPADGATFAGDSCTVTITCDTDGATIYYSTNGSTPRPSNKFKYTGPFAITDTAEICAFAVLGDDSSDYVTATITKTVPIVLTLAGAIDAPTQTVTTGGDADWEPVVDATAVGNHSAQSGAIDPEESTWMEMSASGAGMLTFSWKADCEKDPRNRYSYDCGAFTADGTVKSRIDGTTAWQTVTVEIAEGGAHTFRWSYSKDDYDEDDFEGEDCIWVDNVVWVPVLPSVPGDPGAVVTGDAESGFTVKPSVSSGAVEVAIPDGVDAANVTVEVAPTVESVMPHGATIKIVKGGHDITPYLDIPEADGEGTVATQLATVKEAIVKEAIDEKSGAEIDLKASDPSIKTAPTRPGLTYTFSEGTTLKSMTQKAEKQGDGEPWTPPVTVKGGASGFYSIGVGK